MKKSTTTVSNPVMSIKKGLIEMTDSNLALKVQPASVAEQFAVDSEDGCATIAGYSKGKPLPLCRVTGTE